MSAAAFMAVDTTPFSSITRPQVMLSTKLWAKDDGASEDEKKLVMEMIIDDNRQTLLHPPSSPERPVLVDAFAPWCGPCKLLDKVLRKAQPRYLEKVDFCRWNVNDKENTAELKKIILDSEFTLTKLPSLIVFRGGKPVAVRGGMANEFQLDDFLEKTLPDVLERTFDEDGVKMVPLPEEMMVQKKEEEQETMKDTKISHASKNAEQDAIAALQEAFKQAIEDKAPDDCTDEEECWERLENTVWQNRTVVPAMDGIVLPARS